MDLVTKSDLESQNGISLFQTFLFKISVFQLHDSNVDLNIHTAMKWRVKRTYTLINNMLIIIWLVSICVHINCLLVFILFEGQSMSKVISTAENVSHNLDWISYEVRRILQYISMDPNSYIVIWDNEKKIKDNSHCFSVLLSVSTRAND